MLQRNIIKRYDIIGLAMSIMIITGCSTVPKLPPPPPKYVKEEPKPASSPHGNSLWHDGASLFEDAKARRLNDLVTIRVYENISASGKADTSAGRDSSLEAGIDSLLGIPLNPTLNDGRYLFGPTISGSMKDDFKGSGATTREGKLVGTITAKVTDVMPNGNLVLESRKEITINNEKQILIFRGMVRPDDIAVDNSVMSSKLADAQVFFVGDGVIQNKQRPGWLVRLFDKVWPF